MQTYDFWKKALDGEIASSNVNVPEPGFYKAKKHKDGDWFPVAIWYKEDECLCIDTQGTIDPFSVWPWCAKHPITEEDFRYFEEHNKWPGTIDIGHNNPPSDEIQIEDQIKEVMAVADKWLIGREIKSQAEVDKAAGFKQKLSELSREAEKMRKEEKKPHLDAGKAVDAKYQAIVKLPNNILTRLKGAITPFLVAEQKKADEAARKERIEAAKKIAEAEKIKADKEKKNLTEKEEKTIEEAKTATFNPAPVKVSAGGNTGRKISLKKVTSAEIVDYEKVLIALKDHPEMIVFAQKLCDRAAKAGKELDGMKIKEEQVAA